MAGVRPEDRRIFERFSLKVGLRFLDLNSNREGIGEGFDVSAKGIGIMTSEALNPQVPLEMWVETLDKKTPLYTRGEVIWSRRVDTDKYRVGINLERADLMGVSRLLRKM